MLVISQFYRLNQNDEQKYKKFDDVVIALKREKIFFEHLIILQRHLKCNWCVCVCEEEGKIFVQKIRS